MDTLPLARAIGDVITNGTVEFDLTSQFELQNRRSHELFRDGARRESVFGLAEVTAEIGRGLETLLYEQFITLSYENLAAEPAFMHLGNEVLLDSRRKLLCVGKRWKACPQGQNENGTHFFYQGPHDLRFRLAASGAAATSICTICSWGAAV